MASASGGTAGGLGVDVARGVTVIGFRVEVLVGTGVLVGARVAVGAGVSVRGTSVLVGLGVCVDVAVGG